MRNIFILAIILSGLSYNSIQVHHSNSNQYKNITHPGIALINDKIQIDIDKNYKLNMNNQIRFNNSIFQFSNIIQQGNSFEVVVDIHDNIIISGNVIIEEKRNEFFGEWEVFVAKFTSDGIIIWNRTYGGNRYEESLSLEIDSKNNIIVIGSTESSNFPIFNGYDNTFNGVSDGFVLKIAGGNGDLIWSSFLGGNDFDIAADLSINDDDFIVITGYTISRNFPILNHSAKAIGGVSDIFISVFTPDGNLSWSNLYGGTADDIGATVIFDNNNNIIVGGLTYSADFPTFNGYSNNYNGTGDGFLAKLSNSGVIIWSTYIGGSNFEEGWNIGIENDNSIIFIGNTWSANFPELSRTDSIPIRLPSDPKYNSQLNSFISKFHENGSLLWSKVLRSTFPNEAVDVVVHNLIHVIGFSQASEVSTISYELTSPKNDLDIMISTFDSAEGNLLNIDFIGGNGDDRGFSLDIDSKENLIITGITDSTDYPNSGSKTATSDNDYIFLSSLMAFSPEIVREIELEPIIVVISIISILFFIPLLLLRYWRKRL